jgi:NAD(P)-dependent dehydrogenase (short-subunit alcohol dehydrogenase family)
VTVAVVDIDGDAAARTAAAARAEGHQAHSFAADIGDATDVERLVDAITGQLGPIDIWVNNAGVTQVGRPFSADVTEALFDRIVRVNLKGTWLCMKAVLPGMVARGGGCIVNMASILGLVAERGMAAYAASKHGIIGLTKAAALEYGPQGVRINAICPSRQDGAMLNPQAVVLSPEEKREGDQRLNPASGRAGKPEEVAATILFLCSDGAANIHGAALAVDGGYTAR